MSRSSQQKAQRRAHRKAQGRRSAAGRRSAQGVHIPLDQVPAKKRRKQEQAERARRAQDKTEGWLRDLLRPRVSHGRGGDV